MQSITLLLGTPISVKPIFMNTYFEEHLRTAASFPISRITSMANLILQIIISATC